MDIPTQESLWSLLMLAGGVSWISLEFWRNVRQARRMKAWEDSMHALWDEINKTPEED